MTSARFVPHSQDMADWSYPILWHVYLTCNTWWPGGWLWLIPGASWHRLLRLPWRCGARAMDSPWGHFLPQVLFSQWRVELWLSTLWNMDVGNETIWGNSYKQGKTLLFMCLCDSWYTLLYSIVVAMGLFREEAWSLSTMETCSTTLCGSKCCFLLFSVTTLHVWPVLLWDDLISSMSSSLCVCFTR